jgi:RNA polymerase sigma-70 factor (ECF subfamily)
MSVNISDAVLIKQAFTGDQLAFETLVNRYETTLYNFVKSLLRDHEQAGDVVQFVFLQLYRFLPKLNGNLLSERSKTPLKSWLFQVAANRCKQEIRRKKLLYFCELEVIPDEDHVTTEPDFVDSSPLPEEIAEQRELQHILYMAIQTLPARPRSVVLLRYTEELSFGEIGLRLNMPENTVKSHFHRARRHLRAMLT